MKKQENSYGEEINYSFSLEQLNKIGNNNEEFTIQMLGQFILTAKECSQNMLSAIKQNDWLKVKNAAHKGVSSYSVMDLAELVSIMKTIEAGAETEKEHSSIKALVDIFDKKNRLLIAEMVNYIKPFEKLKANPEKIVTIPSHEN